MKKILRYSATFLVFLLSVVLISACSNSSAVTRSNTIASTDLTDRESWLLFNLSDQSFVYDFAVDNEFNEIEMYVEKYIFGEKQEGNITHIKTDISSEGSIVFTTSKKSEETNEKLFTVGINSDGGKASVTNSEVLAESESDTMATLWQNVIANNDREITNEEIVLASILHSSGDMMSSLREEFYEDIEGNIDLINDYDVVYLLKVRFIN